MCSNLSPELSNIALRKISKNQKNCRNFLKIQISKKILGTKDQLEKWQANLANSIASAKCLKVSSKPCNVTIAKLSQDLKKSKGTDIIATKILINFVRSVHLLSLIFAYVDQRFQDTQILLFIKS